MPQQAPHKQQPGVRSAINPGPQASLGKHIEVLLLQSPQEGRYGHCGQQRSMRCRWQLWRHVPGMPEVVLSRAGKVKGNSSQGFPHSR